MRQEASQREGGHKWKIEDEGKVLKPLGLAQRKGDSVEGWLPLGVRGRWQGSQIDRTQSRTATQGTVSMAGSGPVVMHRSTVKWVEYNSRAPTWGPFVRPNYLLFVKGFELSR